MNGQVQYVCKYLVVQLVEDVGGYLGYYVSIGKGGYVVDQEDVDYCCWYQLQ